MKRIYSFLFASLALLSLAGCNKAEDKPEPTPTPPPTPPKTEETKLNLVEQAVEVEIPSEAKAEYVAELQVSSVYGTYPLTEAGTAARQLRAEDNRRMLSRVMHPNQGLMLVNLVDKSGNIVQTLIQKPNAQRNAATRFNTEQTALSILLQSPMLLTDKVEKHDLIVEALKKLPEFWNFEREIRTEYIRAMKQGVAPNYNKIKGDVVLLALLKKNMENASLTVSGVKLGKVSRKDGHVEFSVINSYKRVIHIYPKKVWMSQGNYDIAKEEELPDLPILLDPTSASYWGIVKDGFMIGWKRAVGGDWESIATKSIYHSETPAIPIKMGDADKVFVDVYGIGSLEEEFMKLPREEQKRLLLAILHGCYNDFLQPMINLAYGIKEVGEATGSDDFRYDFRYGARKSPLFQLLLELVGAFGSDEMQMYNLHKNFLIEDTAERAWAISTQILGFCVHQIAGNVQNSGGPKRRYLNLIYNTLKKYSGVSKTEEEFRKQFKSIANNISFLENANFAGRVIKVAELSLDAGGAIYAYNQSQAKSRFIIDREADSRVELKSPAHNAEVEDSNLTLTWDATLPRHIGTPEFDVNLTFVREGGKQLKVYPNLKEKSLTIDLSTIEESRGATSIEWEVLAHHAVHKHNVLAKSERRIVRLNLSTSDAVPEGVEIKDGVLVRWRSSAIPVNGHVKVPSEVKSIGNYAFQECRNLKTIYLPEGLTSIGDGAFLGCTSLKTISIPNSIKTLGVSVFYNCANLVEVKLPSKLTEIKEHTFNGCYSLNKIELPATIQRIQKYAFSDCQSLTSINLGDNLTSLGNGAFFRCTSLKSVALPTSISSIPDFCFKECSALTAVTIPNSVTRIHEGAFEKCTALTSLTFPKSLQSAYYTILRGCANLKVITCKSLVPPGIGNGYSTASIEYKGKLIVPKGRKSEYENHYSWKHCSPIVEEE